MQLVIPQLALCATPAHLFIKRLKVECAKGLGILPTEVERMEEGRKWLAYTKESDAKP
jgi:hypothetical protein